MQKTIPELNTAFTAPLTCLTQHFLAHRKKMKEWFEAEWANSIPPIYGSIDLRNAGFKLAPIDMNLFPAGFNNLNPEYLSTSALAAKKIILKNVPTAKNILVIPESHTRNLFYWQNIQTLQAILTAAHFNVQLGSLNATPENITLASGETLALKPLQRVDDHLQVDGFVPDLTLLNNDLSAGIPELLQGLKHDILPPAELGWSSRLKSEHFQYYAEVVNEFSQVMQIDPWLISPLFRHCGQIDFMQQEGMDCLASHAEYLFAEIKKKYQEYHIPYQPFLIVKADAGTYGMAVMTIRDVSELKTLNRKQRTRMSMTKGGQPVHRVIIQEGIYTFEMLGKDEHVAEPVIYLWGENVVGGFYRVHKGKGTDENLNAPGMRFEPLPFPQHCNDPCENSVEEVCQNRFYLYGIVAKLSMLAAAREIKGLFKEQNKT